MAGLRQPVTPDGRYFVVGGRLWRMSDPNINPREKSRLVKDPMAARRAIKDAKRAGDHGAEDEAHRMGTKPNVLGVSAGRSGGKTARRTSTGTPLRTRITRIGMRGRSEQVRVA